jgi:hypothetical protein
MSEHIDWSSLSPAIEIRFGDGTPPVARYALSSQPRDGDASFFHSDYQSGTGHRALPACVLPLVDMDGGPVTQLRAALPDTDVSEPVKLVLPRQQYLKVLGPDATRDSVVPALWVQGLNLEQVESLQSQFDLQPCLFIDSDMSATVIGDDAPKERYLVPLPRIVLEGQYYVADNTNDLLSMGTLLESFVERFSGPDRACEQVRVATGYLYGDGLKQVLRLLENPRIQKLQLLFSGRTDRRSAQAITSLFGENLEHSLGLDPELWQTCLDAARGKNKRLEMRVYTSAFLHAKLFLGWEHRNDFGHVEGGRAIVGSSNVSQSGFGSQGNLELNVSVEGAERVGRLADWFERRWEEAARPEPALLDVLKQNQPTPPKPPVEPEFLIDGMKEVWQAGRDQQLADPTHHLHLLTQLYRERLENITILDGPMFPDVAGRTIEPSREQRVGVDALAQRLVDFRVGFLADSVGLGKTVTTLGTAWYLRRNARIEKAAVIAPRKLFSQWRSDAEAIGMPKEVVRYVNRHKLERREPEQAVEELKNVQLIIVEEAHQALRNRRNRLWQNLRAALAANRNTMLLLVSATPWNNSREDIYNYLRLAWEDGRPLEEEYQELRKGVVATHLPLFYAPNATTAARAFEDLSLERYREVFGASFVQRTRHQLEQQEKEAPEFPRRLVHSSEAPSSTPHDTFFEQLEEALGELNLPHYQPFDALQRSASALGSLGDGEMPPPSNLHGSFIIQLYKRAESSLFALAVSLSNQKRKLTAFRRKVTAIRNAEKPSTALEHWLHEVYLRLDEVEAPDDDEEFTLDVQEWMSPAEKVRWANLQSLLTELDDTGVQEVIDHLVAVEIVPELARIDALRHRLTFDLERKDPKAAKLRELLEGHVETGDKVIAVGEFADTATRCFIDAITRMPDQRIALALGGGEAWLYEPGDDKPLELEADEWHDALEQESRERRAALLGRAGRAHRIDRAEALACFSPRARKAQAELIDRIGGEINILVGSDAISVGQNLQDATALVQLDLPWNPMVIEQRIGRIDRRGGGRPPRGDESKGQQVVDVHYCWSMTAIENEVTLRERLRSKTESAIADTNFDELLLFELKDIVEQVKAERGADHYQEEVGRRLDEAQRNRVAQQTGVPGIDELAGSDIDGLRLLRGVAERSDDIWPKDFQPLSPPLGCAAVAEGPQRWLASLALRPIGQHDQPLSDSPMLVHLPIGADQTSFSPNLRIVVERLDSLDGPAGTPKTWRKVLTTLDRHLESWRSELLAEHNKRVRRKQTERQNPTRRETPDEKLKRFAFRARRNLREEAVAITQQNQDKLEPISDKLLFLMGDALLPDHLFELMADRPQKELTQHIFMCAERPHHVLTEAFDETFDAICGDYWARSQQAAAGELGDEVSQGSLDLAELDGPWSELEVSLLALTHLEKTR